MVIRTLVRRLLFFLVFLSFSSEVLAFKIGTHVWVGQTVLNRVKQCEGLTANWCFKFLMVDDSEARISIPADVRHALTMYPAYYLMGNIGPDAFPDVLVGQTVVHPGITAQHASGCSVAHGFGTSDWLGHLLAKANAIPDNEERLQALAFVYGFMGHAAADVFAHTYVNTYAGDTFSLTDGEEEVELRHMALESYIQARTPPMDDLSGDALPEPRPYLVLNTGDLAIPKAFVADNMIFDVAAREQLKNAGVTAAHLAGVSNLKVEIDRALYQVPSGMSNTEYAKSIGKSYLAALGDGSTSQEQSIPGLFQYAKNRYAVDRSQGGSIQQAEVLAIQVLAYYYFGLNLNAQQSSKTAEVLNSFMANQSSTVAHWNNQRNALDLSVMKFSNNFNRTLIRPVEQAEKSRLVNDINQKRTGFMRSLEGYAQAAQRRQQTLNDLAAARARLDAQNLRTLCAVVPETSCKRLVQQVTRVPYPCTRCIRRINGVCVAHVPDTCYRDVSQIIEQVDPICMNQRNQCLAAHRAHADAVRNFTTAVNAAQQRFDAANNDLIGKTTTAQNDFTVLKNAMLAGQTFTNNAYNTAKAWEGKVVAASLKLTEGHRSLLTGWSADIRNSMIQYVGANGQSIVNSLDGGDEGGVLGPLLDWKTCYLPSIMGVPQTVSDATVCSARDIQKTYDELFKSFEVAIAEFDPHVAKQIIQAREELRQSATLEGAKQLDNIFTAMLNTRHYKTAMTAHLLMGGLSNDDINTLFAKDSTKKNLLVFDTQSGSILDRVDEDMKLNGTEFDEYDFYTIRNAITLAGLALASNEGINQLGSPGLVNHVLNNTKLTNLMTRSLRSIDGDHQWREVAPPYPRRGTVKNDTLHEASRVQSFNVDRRFMYQSQLVEDGFVLAKGQLHSQIFTKVFAGPLNSGLYQSADFGFAKLLPADYSYYPNVTNPFP